MDLRLYLQRANLIEDLRHGLRVHHPTRPGTVSDTTSAMITNPRSDATATAKQGMVSTEAPLHSVLRSNFSSQVLKKQKLLS